MPLSPMQAVDLRAAGSIITATRLRNQVPWTDPAFYTVKKELRRRFPKAMIEVIRSGVTIVERGGHVIRVPV